MERFLTVLLGPATLPAHYWSAALAVGAMLLLSWGLYPWLHGRGAFLIFVPAILFAAGLGGLGPGLVATVLSFAMGLLLISAESLTGQDVLVAAIFTIVGCGISWFGEQLRRSRIRDRKLTEDLVAREAHLRSILDAVPDATGYGADVPTPRASTSRSEIAYPPNDAESAEPVTCESSPRASCVRNGKPVMSSCAPRTSSACCSNAVTAPFSAARTATRSTTTAITTSTTIATTPPTRRFMDPP